MFICASTAVAAPAEPLSEEQTPFSPAARGKMSQEKAGTKQAYTFQHGRFPDCFGRILTKTIESFNPAFLLIDFNGFQEKKDFQSSVWLSENNRT